MSRKTVAELIILVAVVIDGTFFVIENRRQDSMATIELIVLEPAGYDDGRVLIDGVAVRAGRGSRAESRALTVAEV